jgi:hypothetical protein
MRPLSRPDAFAFEGDIVSKFVRLTKGKTSNGGFLEIYNRTYDEWSRVCDQTFRSIPGPGG